MPVAPLEKETLKKLDDLMRASAHTGKITHTVFLDPATGPAALAYAKNRFEGACLLFGGYEEAERKVLFLLGDVSPEDADLSQYLSLLRITPADKKSPLAHRDYLGSLLSLQISRERLGDILVAEGSAQVFVLPPTDSFLLQTLDRVGGTTVSLEKLPLGQAAEAVGSGKSAEVSVSSLRLDCVIAAAFHLSRGNASEAIVAGKANVNWRQVEKPDYMVAEGDVLNLRGFGRAKIEKIGGTSRKGRTFVTLTVM
jgi:RNA-binding protein YlmH